MSLLVTQRPSITVGVNTSRWNAVGNPVLYKMQRQDLTFNEVNDNSSFIELKFTGVDVSTSFSIGDQIYIQSDDDIYNLFSEVTSVNFSGGDTFVVVDDAFTSIATTGFTNNLTTRLNYRVEVEVYNVDDELINEEPSVYSPNTFGAVTIDVSIIVRQVINADIEADITGSDDVFEDTPAFKEFYIKYREIWTGSAEAQTDDVANQFLAVLGARQIRSPYGGNLADYVMFAQLNGTSLGAVTHIRTSIGNSIGSPVGVSPDQTDRIKLVYTANANLAGGGANLSGQINLKFELNGIVVFTRLLLSFTIVSPGNASGGQTIYFDTSDFGAGGFDNYYVEVIIGSGTGSFSATATATVYNDLVEGKFLTRFERPKMFRGFPFLISIIADEMPSISGLVVTYYDSSGSVITSVSSTIDPLENSLFIFDITELESIPEDAFTCLIEFVDASGSEPLTLGRITCEAVSPCENPIMLMARNSLGGVMQWVFSGSTEKSPDYGDALKAMRRVLFAENITENDWDALQDFIRLGDVYRNNIVEFTSDTIKTSTRIGHQVYVVDPDGSKIGVIAIPTRNRTETKQKKHRFELEIEYPEEFTP